MECRHEGCDREGIECYPPEADAPADSFCDAHAREHMYCRRCGEFHAHVDPSDSGSGLCDHCEADLDEDEDEPDDEDDYDDDYWCRDRHDY